MDEVLRQIVTDIRGTDGFQEATRPGQGGEGLPQSLLIFGAAEAQT